MKYYKLKHGANGYLGWDFNLIYPENYRRKEKCSTVKFLVEVFPDDWLEVNIHDIPLTKLNNFKFGR